MDWLILKFCRKVFGLIMIIAILTGLSGCGEITEPVEKKQIPEKPVSGDILIEGTIADAVTLNPILASDSASGDVIDLIFDSLIKYNADLEVECVLAESFEVSDNKMELIFHLRKDVIFHDGSPFTAKDVLFTYKLVSDSKYGGVYSSEYKDVSSVTEVDDYTVKIVYSKILASALEAWMVPIVPEHLLKDQNILECDFNRHPVGTGPFKLKDWFSDDKIILSRNEKYFNGTPNLNGIIFQIIPDESVMFLKLKNGEIDKMYLKPDQYDKQATGPEFVARFSKYRYSSFSYTYLGYNLTNPLFQSKKVRQALAHAVDKDNLLFGVIRSLGSDCTGPFLRNSTAYNHQVKKFEYSPLKAREILREEGWNDSDGDGIIDKDINNDGIREKFSFTMMTNIGNRARELTATILQQDFEAIGIEARIVLLEWNALNKKYIDTKKFDSVILGWSLPLDPDLFNIWHSSSIENGNNFVSYRNPEADLLWEQGRVTLDKNERAEIYKKLHSILADDQPYMFLYVKDSLDVVDKRFRNVILKKSGIRYNLDKWFVPQNHQKYVD